MPVELILQLADTDHIDSIVSNSASAPELSRLLSGITLGALGELVCWGAQWASDERGQHVEHIRRWAREHGPLANSWRALRAPATLPAQTSTSCFEVRPVPRHDEVGGLEWARFQQRFSERLTAHGFHGRLARALSKAFIEMADNVICHSGPDSQAPASGIVAYHVEDRWMAYAVADTGRGILASLRTAPRWQHLSTSIAALQAVLHERATCRPEFEQGGGYKQVVHSLAELNGFLRFRTGDAQVELRGTAADLQQSGGPVPWLSGLQLVVHCALDGATPGERLLPPDL